MRQMYRCNRMATPGNPSAATSQRTGHVEHTTSATSFDHLDPGMMPFSIDMASRRTPPEVHISTKKGLSRLPGTCIGRYACRILLRGTPTAPTSDGAVHEREAKYADELSGLEVPRPKCSEATPTQWNDVEVYCSPFLLAIPRRQPFCSREEPHDWSEVVAREAIPDLAGYNRTTRHLGSHSCRHDTYKGAGVEDSCRSFRSACVFRLGTGLWTSGVAGEVASDGNDTQVPVYSTPETVQAVDVVVTSDPCDIKQSLHILFCA